MVIYEKNRPIKISYSARGFTSGLSDVTVTVYNSAGGIVLSSSTMTEVGSTGIYVKSFTPPRDDTYFAICNSTSLPLKDFVKLVVGEIKTKSGGGVVKGERIWSITEKEFVLEAIKKLLSLKFPAPNFFPFIEKLSKLEKDISLVKKKIPFDRTSEIFTFVENVKSKILSSLRDDFFLKQNSLLREIADLKKQLNFLMNDHPAFSKFAHELHSVQRDLDHLLTNAAQFDFVEIVSTPVLDLPQGKGPFRFVIQYHDRGKSRHSDLRFEVNDHLIGFTLDDPGVVGGKGKLSNIPGMSGRKILAQIKSRQPKIWLNLEGEIKPGDPGATKFLPARFTILDKGYYEMGAQKPALLETFLHGKLFQGRFLARKLPRQKKYIKAGKTPFVWFVWKAKDQTPHVLSSRARREDWVPPKGISALPEEWQNKIPKDLRWWEEGIIGERADKIIEEEM